MDPKANEKGMEFSMNISLKLGWRYLKNNKKRSITTIIGIIIVTILLISVILLSNIYQSYMISVSRANSNWEVKFTNIEYNKALKLTQNSDIKEISLVQDIGIGEENYSENNLKMNIYLKAYSLNAIKNFGINLIQGRLPETKDEIVLSRNLINVNSMDEVNITINGKIKEYKVVGIIEPPDFEEISMQNMIVGAITLLDESTLFQETIVDVSVIFKDINKAYDISEEIAKVLKLYNSETELQNNLLYNTNLLHYSGIWNMENEEDVKIILPLIFFIIIIGIIASVFLYSIFNMTVIQRKKEYANLNSIGANKKQIFNLIFIETTIMLLIAVPIGLVFSLLITFANINQIEQIIVELSKTNSQLNFELNISYNLIIVIIVLIFLIAYLSVILPAIRASKYSIIDKIKENETKFNKRALKVTSKTLESTLTHRSIWKHKNKYIVMMINVMLAVFMVVFSQSYINSMYNSVTKYNPNYTLNIDSFELANVVKEKFLETNTVEEIYEYAMDQLWIYIDEKNINESLKQALKNSPDLSERLFAGDTDYEIRFDIFALSGDEFEKYLNKLGLDRLNDNECILVNYDDVKTKYYEGIYFTNYAEGDTIKVYVRAKKDKHYIYDYERSKWIKSNYRKRRWLD